MKFFIFILVIPLVLLSCNNSSTNKPSSAAAAKLEKQSFFPVTEFLKGEIYTIKNRGINPLKYTTIHDHTDSVWLKIEDLDSAVDEFFHPEIDTSNLTSLFTEKSFLDQSIDAVTLTYDPVKRLPDSMLLTHWDVYIDPTTNNVKRIYMVKEMRGSKTLQLTWVSKKWCKITTIITDKNGVSTIEKEEKLFWGF